MAETQAATQAAWLLAAMYQMIAIFTVFAKDSCGTCWQIPHGDTPGLQTVKSLQFPLRALLQPRGSKRPSAGPIDILQIKK